MSTYPLKADKYDEDAHPMKTDECSKHAESDDGTKCGNCHVDISTLKQEPFQDFSDMFPARPALCTKECKLALWKQYVIHNDGTWVKQAVKDSRGLREPPPLFLDEDTLRYKVERDKAQCGGCALDRLSLRDHTCL